MSGIYIERNVNELNQISEGCLNMDYSTTRLAIKERPIIKKKIDDKFETLLFLPESESRRGAGGLRTQGYFKKNHPDKPLITVITVVFNGEKFLEETIQSVINQTYDNVEYIIVDGCSTDGTLDIIRRYEHAIDYWVSEKDTGIYDAWNKAVKASLGEWISFVGADDTYMHGALDLYIKKLYELPDVNYISSLVNLKSGERLVRVIGEKFNLETFKRRMHIAHVGSLHKRELFASNGLFSLNFKVASDYEFFARVRHLINAAFLNMATATMRVGGASDGNPIVFNEVAEIKVKYKLRNSLSAYVEALYSRLKWFIRRKVWY